jgi:hypothetical protein
LEKTQSAEDQKDPIGKILDATVLERLLERILLYGDGSSRGFNVDYLFLIIHALIIKTLFHFAELI